MSKSIGLSITIGAVLAGGAYAALGKTGKSFKSISDRISLASVEAEKLGRAVQAAFKLDDIQKNSRDTAEYYRELGKVRREYENAAAAVAHLGKNTAEWTKAQKRAIAASSRWKVLGNALDVAKAGIKFGTPLMATATAAMVESGMDFEASMSKVGAVSRATTEDLARMTEKARELGASTEWSATQAAEGMQYLAMAGFDVNDILETMPGMLSLASAAGLDLGASADIASNILSGFSLEASEMGRVGDVLVNAFTSSNTDLQMLGQTMKYMAPAAKAMGVSLEESAAMAGMLGNAGIQADQAGTSLRQMMVRMVKPTKQVSQAMKQIGLEVKNQDGSMKSMTRILEEMAAKTSKLTDAERLRISAQIFGTEALSAGLVLMEQASTGTLAEYTEKLKEQGTAQRVAGQQTDNLKGDIKALGSALEEVGLSIFDTLQPALRDMAKGLTEVIRGVGDFVKGHPGFLDSVIAMGRAFGDLVNGGIWLFTSAMKGVGETLDSISKGIAEFLQLIGKALEGLAALTIGKEKFEQGKALTMRMEEDGVDPNDAEAVAAWASEQHLASGGIATGPTRALIGEGGEPEAVLPLSKLSALMGGGAGGMNVSFAPVINVSGAGQDVYGQVRGGLTAGAEDLKRQLQALMREQRRVSYS